MEFKEIESKWQKVWEENKDLYVADDKSEREKKYVLVEFPYPSGSGLHIGHAFSFTGGDVYARFNRMQGKNVLFPMGWDAFGLPTENYAIKTKQKPQKVTKDNTDMFRSQMKRLAFSFDWSREVNTTDPNYYKWTQWIFIKLFEKGLAYKQEMPINWCPSCKIGLANEEVVNGKCERCGTEVERRTISQWVVRITEYADRLTEGLKNTDFIDKVKQAQVNWIGKSEGARIKFKIKSLKSKVQIKELEVFTTRPDTLYGVTFIVISPEHELAMELGKENKDTSEYQKISRSKSDLERTELNREKTGVFSGLYAINPVNGKEIPIWISDFVLASYGTGAIMAVPAHDERDNAFAKKFGLEIIGVIDKGGKMKDSEMLNSLGKEEAIKKMIELLKGKGIGGGANSYHLRDWIFSRQHYWGEPIPMVDCPKCGWVPEKEENLPIVLPEVEAYEPTDDGKSPLSKIESFVNCKCPKCGGDAKRETDTMPNWAGSDWYYLAYCFADRLEKSKDQKPKTKENEANDTFVDIFSDSCEILKKWLPVDVYIGGDEHNTLHLLYSRFIYQFLYDLGVLPKEHPEPYQMRTSHGVILGPDNQRMSKSKGNVIVPESVADKYGVDVARMYLMFMGPFDGTMAWNENTLMGVKRFLERFEKAVIGYQLRVTSDSRTEVKLIINKTIDGVTRDIEKFGYNTAIAKMMECLNRLTVNSYELTVEEVKILVKLLAPFAPYTAEELWSILGEGNGRDRSVHLSEWPKVDLSLLVEETVTLAVAINGKVRDEIVVESQKSKAENQKEVIEMAKATEKMKKWLEGKKVLKEIYVPGKMVNLVVAQ